MECRRIGPLFWIIYPCTVGEKSWFQLFALHFCLRQRDTNALIICCFHASLAIRDSAGDDQSFRARKQPLGLEHGVLIFSLGGELALGWCLGWCTHVG